MTSIKAIVRGFAQIFLKIKMYNDNGCHATKRKAKLGYKNMLYEHLTKCLNTVHKIFFSFFTQVRCCNFRELYIRGHKPHPSIRRRKLPGVQRNPKQAKKSAKGPQFSLRPQRFGAACVP